MMFLEKKRVVLALFAFLFVNLIHGLTTQIASLKKVQVDTGLLGEKLLCFFDKEPICTYIPNRPTADKKKNTEMTFFFPGTRIAGGARSSVSLISGRARNGYMVTLQEVTAPVSGIRVTVVYDSEKILCDYAASDSIQEDKVLAFRFHNKQVLKDIEHKTEGVLRSAQYTPFFQMNSRLARLQDYYFGYLPV